MTHFGGFPGGPVVKTAFPLQGAWVQSLVRELRSHMLIHCKKKKKKENLIKKIFKRLTFYFFQFNPGTTLGHVQCKTPL